MAVAMFYATRFKRLILDYCVVGLVGFVYYQNDFVVVHAASQLDSGNYARIRSSGADGIPQSRHRLKTYSKCDSA